MKQGVYHLLCALRGHRRLIWTRLWGPGLQNYSVHMVATGMAPGESGRPECATYLANDFWRMISNKLLNGSCTPHADPRITL